MKRHEDGGHIASTALRLEEPMTSVINKDRVPWANNSPIDRENSPS